MTDFNNLFALYANDPAGNQTNNANIPIADPYPSRQAIDSKRTLDGAYPNPFVDETAPSLLDNKKASVATAAEQKKTAMGGNKPSILPSLDQSYQTSVGGLTGQGQNTMSEYERDIRTLGPNDLRFKYGSRQAAEMIGQANKANQEAILDSTASRTTGQIIGDSVTDAVNGFAMPILSIGAMQAGMYYSPAGVAASQGLTKLNNWSQKTLQSDELGQRRKVNAARNALDSRESVAQQGKDLASGDSELYADLKRIGRGAVNAVGNATDDSAILGSGIANAAGSLLSGSFLAGGARKAAMAVVDGLGSAGLIKSGGLVSSALSRAEIASAVDSAAMPLTIGAMESAGVYQQTASDIAATPVEKLAETSDLFQQYVASGMTPEQARTKLSNRAAMTAAAITAPVAVAAGKLVSHFEMNPFAKTTFREAGKDAIRETVEEGIQSGWGTFSQNLLNKAVVDPNQDVLANVGEQAGEGGLYGFGSAGGIHGPAAVKNAVFDSSKYMWGKASGAMADAAAKLEAKNEAASPLAPNKVAAEVAATQAAMPETAAAIQAGIDTSSLNQEEKTEGQAYAATLTNSLVYGETESAHLANHPIGAVVAGSKDKAEAMLKLAKFVNENGDAEQGTAAFDAAQELNNYVLDLEEALRTEPASLSKLPDNHPAVVQMKAIKDTLEKVNAQPIVKKALAKADAIAVAFNASFVASTQVTLPAEVEAAQQLLTAIDKGGIPLNPAKLRVVAESLGLDVNSKANPTDTINRIREAVARSVQQATPTGSAVPSMTEASLATPEGQQYAQTAANVIAHDPAKANPALVNAVLAHAASGKLVLTEKQQKGVDVAKALFDTSREDFANRERLGLKTQDVVSNQIQSAEYLAQGQESAVQHATKVYNAYRANDLTAAKWYLEDFKKFAESIQNKLAALNEHLNNRQGRKSLNYQTVDQRTREWKTSTDPVGITPTSVGSVEFMQDVAADAKMLVAVYENLKSTFPELKGNELKAVALDSRIDKPATEVVAEFKTGVEPAPAVAPKVEPENKASAAIEAAVSPALVPVVEAAATTAVAKKDEKVNTLGEPVQKTPKTEQVAKKEVTATQAQYGEAVRISNSNNEADLDNVPEDIGEIINALNDNVDVKIVEPKAKPKPRETTSTKTLSESATNLVDKAILTEDYPETTAGVDRFLKAAQQRFAELQEKDELSEQDKKVFGPLYEWFNKRSTADLESFYPDSEKNRSDEQVRAMLASPTTTGSNPGTSVPQAPQGSVITTAPEPINIWYGSNKSAELSNLAARPFTFNARNYLSVEHAYQSNKGGVFDETTFKKYTKAGVKIVGTKGTKTTGGYNLKLMRTLIKASFYQNPDAANALLATGNAQFTHTQDKGVWAKEFPRILMEVRTALAAKPAVEPKKKVEPVVAEPTTVVPSLVQEEETDPIEEEDDSDVTPFVYTGEATGLREVPEFSNLFGGTANRFLDAYKLPAEPTSRVSLADDALTTVAKAVSSDNKLQAFMDAAPKSGFSSLAARIYTQYATKVGAATLTKLNENLAAWLNKKSTSKKTGITSSRLEQVMKPGFVNNWENGKILNVLQNDNGKLSYDSKLIEGAVLAGLQWLITSEGVSGRMNTSRVASALGVFESEVPAGLPAMLSIGQGELEATRALGRKIKEYWGLEGNKDYPMNVVDGIPDSLAAEVLRSFEEMGLIKFHAFWFDDQLNQIENNPKNTRLRPTGATKMHNRVEVKLADSLGKSENFKALQSYPDAIEQAVMVKPEQTVYLEDERPDVARTQMRNPGAKNKKQALKSIEVNQDTAYKFTHQYKLYEALAAKGFGKLMQLFGFGELTADDKANKFNKNHLVSVEGKNQSIVSAINGMDYLDAQVKARAEAIGKAPEEIEVHFAHNNSKVQRLQQEGRVTPQGDKNMRAVLSPHEAVLDLDDTRRKDYKNFLLAIAQAVGIKIHNIKPEIVHKQIQKLLNNELKPAVDVLQDWSKNMDRPIQDDAADIFLQSFKDAKMDFSNLALQSLTEYALYLNAERGKGRTAFPVTLYGEADGMQNGPGGAMILHSTGPFTVHQLQMMRKVGYYPGQKDWTAQDQFARDKVDTYGTVAELLTTLIPALQTTYAATSQAAANQVTQLLNLLDLLFEGNLSYDSESKVLTIKRGAGKSPVTVTIYGAGQWGIATKIAGIIVDELYEKMSAVAAAKYENSSADAAIVMFGSQAKYDKFANSWYALTNFYVGFNDTDNEHYLGNTKVNVARIDSVDHTLAVNYTVEPDVLQALTGNVYKMFVEPMNIAIRETMGESLMNSMALIRQATQVQTIFLEDAFQTEVKKALVKKEKEDPNFQKGDFLSENELKKILDKLKYMMPKIDNGTQEYYLAGSSSAELGDVKPFGMSLNEHFKTPAMVYGPKDLGVGGIAALNIGMVDGQMIMNFYWDGEVIGTLPVFDGINIPLDKLGEYSEKANKAIFDAWMGNAMKALSESYSVFMQDTDITAYLRSPQLKDKLAKAFYGQRTKGEDIDNGSMAQELSWINRQLKVASVDIETRHLAMQDIGAGIDQMAGFSSPHWHEGTISVGGMADEQIIEVLNERKAFHRAKVIKDQIKTQDISEAVSNSGLHDIATGAKVFYQQNLSFLGSQMNIPQEQRWMYNELVNSKALEDWTFITGTNEQIRAKAEQLGVAAAHLNNMEKGLTLTGQKIIMFPNATSETLVHEMVHAATFSIINAYYSSTLPGKGNADIAGAVEGLEILMRQFMELGEELPALSMETTQQYLHARSVIQNHLNQGKNPLAKASALNEFMAYTQSNPALIRMTKNTTANPLVRISRMVLEFIKELVWGKRAPKVGGDMFTTIRFNTALLAHYQPSVGQTAAAANAALAHTAAAMGNPRLMAIRDYFVKKIPNHLKTPVDRNNFGTAAANIHATSIAAQAAITAAQHGFRMDHLEDSTFTAIVQSLATQATIDPNSMARAQELFTLATKKLEIKDFIDPTNTDSASALYYAKEQYELVMGEYAQGTDKLGRSTLLPVFLGLAMVNNHFRSVLSKLELPKSKLKEWDTADNAFENLGKMGLDALSARLSGEGKHAPNVQAALDALTNHLLETAKYDAMGELVEGALDWREGRLNKRNNRLVGYMNKAGKALYTASTYVLNNPEYGKFSKSLAQLGKLTSAIINEENADIISQGIVSTINKMDGFRSLREVIADMVGRTKNKAEIYDQNKLLRSMVSQDRQHYREDLPEIIRSKFSRDVVDVEMTAMFHGLGKTDIAVLRETMKDGGIRELFTKASALPMAIRAVESQLKTADPKHWNQVEKKARQLADFMNGKGAGTNLLRNAEAVSGLFSEKVDPKRTKPDDVFIKAVDKLITLYALDGMNDVHRDSISSLVQSEASGVDFVMAYLTGQRAEEMRKAQSSPTARENYFKGYVPSEQDGGVSLIVANDSEYSSLVGRSFTKVESYKGSSLIGGEPKSYYFAKVPGRAAYNQGTMQNVRQTAGGIDLSTGFADGMMVAGRITDKRLVFKLAQNMANERATNEPLMPIYSNGVVVAFERAVDPLQLERLSQSTDLAKMIGVWRGRQVEEAKVQVFNEALVDAAKRMYKTDLQDSSAKKAEYINVFDPKEQKKDPVMADAVRLLNPETLAYIEDVFGEGNFPVRKDMLNDMLGYRNATVGDMWTGNHRWSPETEHAVKNIAISMFGNKAYQYLVNSEKIAQNVVSSAKTLIVMKSIVVPVANLIGNVYQLASRGIPLMAIARGLPRKALEIDSYAKSRTREVEAEAELRAAEGDAVATRRLTTELQSIKDSHKRLSIWPLIEAGQFSAISDMGVSRDEVNLTDGKLHDYIEGLVDRLPDGIRNAGRYALVTKDTALFRGLQKSVDYGDFIAKAVLYDDLTKREELTSAQALARVTEEFVNYDRLPGRTRGYLENMGLLWFYNFKLRLVKIALSTIRNNPVHALMVGMMPKPDIFGSIGTPITDNVFSKALSGGLSNSIGPGMLFNAPMLLPTVNAVFD